MSFRPLNFAAPASSPLYKLIIENFKGVDLVSGESNFSPSRAAELQNFIRNKVGQVKKRGGFMQRGTFEADLPQWIDFWCGLRIHFDGIKIHFMSKNESGVYQEIEYPDNDVFLSEFSWAIGWSAGDQYIVLGLTAAENISVIMSYSAKDQTWTFVKDPLTGYVYTLGAKTDLEDNTMLGGSASATKMMHSDFLTIPAIVENANPGGGGVQHLSPNLLTPLVTETFTVSSDDLSSYKKGDVTHNICKRFQLSSKDISLMNGSEVIDAPTWMKPGTYWTNESGYRTLTQLGATVLKNSIKIEVFAAVGDETQLDYEWQEINLSGVFASGSKNFVNPESAALWIPDALIGVAPEQGEANVRITYIRNVELYKEGLKQLMTCNKMTKYGVGGYKDRVFLAGENKIFYSGIDDPLYFGELCYIEPCAADKSIIAMGGQGQFLYAVDSDGITHVISGTTIEEDTNTFLLDAAFIIADRVQGEKPVGSVLKIFGGEFCYLSEEGVVAIRHDNFYDKRYAQNRSRMLGESVKGKIVGATVWGSFLVIATETQLYLLDEMQQTRLEDYKYSGVQYEVFPFTFDMETLQFSIKNIWTEDDELRLGVLWGGVYVELAYSEGNTQDEVGGSVADIVAEWVTPPLSLEEIHRKKHIQEFWLAVGEEGDCVSVDYRTNQGKEWRVIRQDWGTLRQADGRFVAFDYNSIDYGAFSYNGQVPKLQMSVRGRPSRPFNSVQFRFKSMGHHGLTLTSFGFYYKKEVI